MCCPGLQPGELGLQLGGPGGFRRGALRGLPLPGRGLDSTVEHSWLETAQYQAGGGGGKATLPAELPLYRADQLCTLHAATHKQWTETG